MNIETANLCGIIGDRRFYKHVLFGKHRKREESDKRPLSGFDFL